MSLHFRVETYLGAIALLPLLSLACSDGQAGPETDDGKDSLDGGATDDDGSDSEDGASGDGDAATGGSEPGEIPCPYYDPECEGPVDPDVPPPTDEDFALIWQDDFDTFDGARWEKRDHTFAENAAYFSHDNAFTENGKLILSVTKKENYDPSNEYDKPYLGAEIMTKERFKHVRISARIKFAKGEGLISSLFTFSDNAGVFWNEIDVEYLGHAPQEVQYNLITSNCPTCGNDRTAKPHQDLLGVFPYEDFHTYVITWLPTGVSFKVDNLPRWSHFEPTMTEQVTIRLNAWPTSGVDAFAGMLNPADIPTQAEYDWLRVEQYIGD